eukprot:scaffold2825_cov97-Skeletonema_dohrnii-CCMP3373.AAC.8
MEEFHTPESSGYPDQMRTPGTVSAAQRSSLPASTGGGGGTTPMMTTTSGKKRPASSDNDDDSDDSMDNNTSFFGRIVSSVTPWRRKNKRSRSSLDSMSGSAIKSASRLPASEDSDRSNNSNGDGGSGSGKKTLGKLNLEHKFHEAPAAAAAATAAMPVQTLNGQQTANNNNEGNGPAKRVRLAEGTVTAATTNGGDGGAIKAVRIGGTTFVSSNTTTTATAKSNTSSQSVTFQDATMPKFNIGSTTKLKDVRGRTATPARGGRSSKWGTPSTGARYGSKNTLPQDGLMTGPSGIAAATTTTNKGGYQRRSINGLSTNSRGGGAYRRRAINARGFKPMSSLLSRIHSDSTNGGGRNNGVAATGQSKQQSLFLSNSIADQILRDAQNKLFQSTASSGGGGGNYQEVALFGVAPSDNNNNNGARTFEEEAAQYKAVTNKGSAVPRVRMNRVFGSGQLGGRAQQLESAPSTANTTAKSFGTGGTTTATAGFGTTASISLQPSIASKSMVPAATSFSAPSASTQIVAAPKAVAFAPFKIDPIPARGEGKTQLTPCRADDNLSQQLGDEISQLVSTDAFKRKAVQNNPFEDVSEATKTPKKKSKGTPHPKKAGGSTVKPVSEAAGGTPFNFMPGGAAASSKVDVPLAFNYGKKSDVPQSSSPAISKSPAKAVAPVATDTSETTTTTSTTEGWGNIFANQKKQWKCNACTSQNPLTETSCLSCEAPREGTASKSDAAPGSGKSGSDKKASIGTGGFKFGAPASTAAPAPAASSAGSIGAGGFSFGGASSSSASAATPAIKFGVTPSKKEEQKDDTKTSAGSGFSFGGSATPAKAKPSSGGFSFGGTSTTPSSTTESNVGANDDKKDDTSKGSIGFSFGASTSSTTSSSKTNATFSFGQSSASSGADENKGDTVNTGAFKFGATSSDPKPKRGRGGDEENDKQDGGKKKASVGAGFSF